MDARRPRFRTSHFRSHASASAVHDTPTFSRRGKSILYEQDLTSEDRQLLRASAESFHDVTRASRESLRGLRIAFLFSGTAVLSRVAFESAANRLGAAAVQLTLERVRELPVASLLSEELCDALVMNHPDASFLLERHEDLGKPVIHALPEILATYAEQESLHSVSIRMAILDLVLSR